MCKTVTSEERKKRDRQEDRDGWDDCLKREIKGILLLERHSCVKIVH